MRLLSHLKPVPGSSTRRCQDIARRSRVIQLSAIPSREGGSLLETTPGRARPAACGFPGMASGCAEVAGIRLCEKILMNEGAIPFHVGGRGSSKGCTLRPVPGEADLGRAQVFWHPLGSSGDEENSFCRRTGRCSPR